MQALQREIITPNLPRTHEQKHASPCCESRQRRAHKNFFALTFATTCTLETFLSILVFFLGYIPARAKLFFSNILEWSRERAMLQPACLDGGMAAAEVKPSTPRSILRREAPDRSPTEGATRKTVTFEVRQQPHTLFSTFVSPARTYTI